MLRSIGFVTEGLELLAATVLTHQPLRYACQSQMSKSEGVRREVAELIETLLDLVLRHRQPGNPENAERSTLSDALFSDLLQSYSPINTGSNRAILRALHLLEALLRKPSASPFAPLGVMSGRLADSG